MKGLDWSIVIIAVILILMFGFYLFLFLKGGSLVSSFGGKSMALLLGGAGAVESVLILIKYIFGL